jgi:hypothetical protein
MDDEVARSAAPTPLIPDEDKARLCRLLAGREAAPKPRDEAFDRLKQLLRQRRPSPRPLVRGLLTCEWGV